MLRGPVAQIDLSSLRHNLAVIGERTRKTPVIGVVKADAYGHGAAGVAAGLVSGGVKMLAVAYTGEAKQLRDSGITAKIIVLFDESGPDEFIGLDLTPVLRDRAAAKAFSLSAARQGKEIAVHIKVDTGMGRMGLLPDRAVEEIVAISEMDGIRLEGLLSHFSEADLADRTYALHQIRVFSSIRDQVAAKTGLKLFCHMANSAAVFSLPDATFDAVRPGIALYGYSPFSEDSGLRPVMKVKSNILSVRELPAGSPVSYGRTFITARKSRIAVVPVGYADGYNRLFSNNSVMLVKGQKAPVVGRVCMDVTMIDVTGIPEVSEGDEVVLLGIQGREHISAADLAAKINTIPYEILTSLGSRSRKEFVR